MSEAEQKWRLVGAKREPSGPISVTEVRDLEDEEADSLQAAARLVDRLARQPEFRRTIDCAARLERTLEFVESQTPAGVQVAAGFRRCCELDLVAVAKAGEQCADRVIDSAQKITTSMATPPPLKVLIAARDFLRAGTEYLVLQKLATDAAGRGLTLRIEAGAIQIEDGMSYDPRVLARALVGFLFYVIAAYLDTFNNAFNQASDQITAAAAEVADGDPQLIRINPQDASMKMNVMRFPIVEIEALRRFREIAVKSTGQWAMVTAAMQLMASVPNHRFAVGGVDVSPALKRGTASDSINVLATAGLELDVDLMGSTVIDYWAPVTYDASHGQAGRRLFTGAVKRVRTDQGTITLECESAADLTEHNPRGIATANLSGDELIRSIIEQAGLPEGAIYLDGEPPEQLEETFEVLAPVRGFMTDEPVPVGDVTLVPTDQAEASLVALGAASEAVGALVSGFRHATCYASTAVTARTLPDAEELGWKAIEIAISWLTASQRIGIARSQDGSANAFFREAALHQAVLAPYVLVRGTATGRQWLRRTHGGGIGNQLLSQDSELVRTPLPKDLMPAERRSLLALRRAIGEVGVENQVQAIWEALESYAAGVKPPKLFSRDLLDQIRTRLPADLTDEQADKLNAAVGDLNRPPLGVRLRWRLARDGITLADHEAELIFTKLRNARNDFAHGRIIADLPTRSDMILGVSVTARIVLFGIAARTS
jgi:hypothetical protein